MQQQLLCSQLQSMQLAPSSKDYRVAGELSDPNNASPLDAGVPIRSTRPFWLSASTSSAASNSLNASGFWTAATPVSKPLATSTPRIRAEHVVASVRSFTYDKFSSGAVHNSSRRHVDAVPNGSPLQHLPLRPSRRSDDNSFEAATDAFEEPELPDETGRMNSSLYATGTNPSESFGDTASLEWPEALISTASMGIASDASGGADPRVLQQMCHRLRTDKNFVAGLADALALQKKYGMCSLLSSAASAQYSVCGTRRGLVSLDLSGAPRVA